MMRNHSKVVAAVLGTLGLAALLLGRHRGPWEHAALAQTDDPPQRTEKELAELKAEVASLRSALSTATAMHEIDYHTKNLWFAGAAGNWPLAAYYWDKVLLHMRLSANASVAEPRADQSDAAANKQSGLDEPARQQIATAIQKQDVRGFAVSYHALLQGCYDCHKAAGKPYLRPRMPVPPAQSIITVSTKESWPK